MHNPCEDKVDFWGGRPYQPITNKISELPFTSLEY